MKIKQLIALLLTSFLFACHPGTTKETPVSSDTVSAKELPQPDTSTVNKVSSDTVAHLVFTQMGTQEVKGVVKAKGPKFICHFTVPGPANLTAIVLPEKKDCNIRIINIILPRKIMDGPYGRELKYKLPVKGEYQLVLGNNMMAGDPETCDFTLKIKLE